MELVQEVEILGKVFRFRTCRVGESGLSVRTEVVLDGKVVATRQSCFSHHSHHDEGVARDWMKEQHKRVLEMFLARALRYQARDLTSTATPRLGPSPAAAEPGHDRGEAPPSSEMSAKLARALEVRRFFGSFSNLVGTSAKPSPLEFDLRLGQAVEAFDWMIRSSLFQEIRLDEQVRCHLLKDEIDDWLSGNRDPDDATRIWSEIITFKNYMAEINHRAEIVSFDRRMIVWALDRVRRRGMTEDVLGQLAWLYGLFPQLSWLLDHPEEVTDESWLAHLGNALTLTDPRSQRP